MQTTSMGLVKAAKLRLVRVEIPRPLGRSRPYQVGLYGQVERRACHENNILCYGMLCLRLKKTPQLQIFTKLCLVRSYNTEQ